VLLSQTASTQQLGTNQRLLQGDPGQVELFGVMVLVVPTLIVFSIACAVVWFACPRWSRPLAIALCSVPCAPIYNDSAWWPLWACSIDRYVPGYTFDVVWQVALTALIVYGLTWMIVRMTQRPAAGQTSA